MVNKSYIGIGSNIDDRLLNIEKALFLLNENNNCKLIKVSSIYESKPYGYTDQNNFLNSVAEILTSLNLKDLFRTIKEIEKKVGRQKRERWGPREIDLDILFYNDVIYNDDELSVPHKDILNRDFVLVPLCEIAQEFIHPKIKKKICEFKTEDLENNIILKKDHNFLNGNYFERNKVYSN